MFYYTSDDKRHWTLHWRELDTVMEERRKSRRIGLKGVLTAKRIDFGNSGEITIDIQDISKSGIGFFCKERLEMNAVYEAHIVIWTKETIHTLLQIVRIAQRGEEHLYGAVFMGLSEIDAFRISVYEAVDKERNSQGDTL